MRSFGCARSGDRGRLAARHCFSAADTRQRSLACRFRWWLARVEFTRPSSRAPSDIFPFVASSPPLVVQPITAAAAHRVSANASPRRNPNPILSTSPEDCPSPNTLFGDIVPLNLLHLSTCRESPEDPADLSLRQAETVAVFSYSVADFCKPAGYIAARTLGQSAATFSR